MKEPTRQQIKEAFKETIERWEKIVEDPSYYHESDCQLCRLHGEDKSCHRYCPIRDYGDHAVCCNTPHDAFSTEKTPQNALVELNFLRKVYIWWIEKQGKDVYKQWLQDNKEEKKEEWVDVAEELTAQVYVKVGGFAVNIYHNDLNVAFIDGDGICIRSEGVAYDKYKVSVQDEAFRILKKQ